jgi:hypothetical protein
VVGSPHRNTADVPTTGSAPAEVGSETSTTIVALPTHATLRPIGPSSTTSSSPLADPAAGPLNEPTERQPMGGSGRGGAVAAGSGTGPAGEQASSRRSNPDTRAARAIASLGRVSISRTTTRQPKSSQSARTKISGCQVRARRGSGHPEFRPVRLSCSLSWRRRSSRFLNPTDRRPRHSSCGWRATSRSASSYAISVHSVQPSLSTVELATCDGARLRSAASSVRCQQAIR